MSNGGTSSGPTDWAQLFQQSLGPPTPTSMFGRVSSDSTVVTTTSSAASPTVAGAPGGAAAPSSIEGRVGKSARRRSRASRRAPTTLLNTDAANFRAMVQQFTGIPSSHYSTSYQPVISFGLGINEQIPQAAPAPAPYRQQQLYQIQQFQQYQQQQQQQRQNVNLFSPGNNGSNDSFIQGFNGNPRNEEFFMDVVSGQLMPRAAPVNDRTTTTDGYNF